MIRVIINADDLGLNSVVNTAISEAFRLNYITSSTILANSNTWDQIHDIVNNNPFASFGVHLNLTQGQALTVNDAFVEHEIVNEGNCFTKKIVQADKTDARLLEAIYNEWDAQISKVKKEGINITHIDGHHHIHADYAFRRILLSLLKKHNILIARNKYLYPNRGFGNFINCLTPIWTNTFSYKTVSCINKLLNNIYISIMCNYMEAHLWRKFLSKDVLFTDYFDSYQHFTSQIRKGNILQDNVVVELMCHPGHNNYQNEYKMIKNSVLEQLLQDVNFVSYNYFHASLK